MSTSPVLSRALFGAVTLLGVGAFVYPFFLSSVERANEQFSHASDAPVLFAILAPVLLLVAVVEVRAGRLDSKHVALLGILGGINAVLRLPTGLAGAKLIYVLPIVCGYSFGPGFGFLLGAATMGVSSVITGGVGPWVPFQMWALGWVGGGAGLLRPALGHIGGKTEIAGLIAYGWIAGYFYGALMNLWFWPYLGSLSEQLSWQPGLGFGETLVRYWRFYVATSLHWDSAAAITNALVVAAVGRPALRVLERFRLRFTAPVFEVPSTPPIAQPGRV